MRRIIPTAVIISVGLITLLGYFINTGALLGFRLLLVDWAAILGGLAIFIGLANVIISNWQRVDRAEPGWVYSMITVVAAIGTLIIGIIESGVFGAILAALSPQLESPGVSVYREGTITSVLFKGILQPSQAALLSMVMFLLVVSAVRLVQNNPTRWTILFIGTIVFVLLFWLPFRIMAPANALQRWFMAVPVAAGARGLLIGVALGTLTVGIRVLTGLERIYKD